MNRDEIVNEILKKESAICVGLDSDFQLLPDFLKNEKMPQFAFNKQIIDAVSDKVVACKLNTAFYESQKMAGWQEMFETAAYIKKNFPHIFLIADAKRSDIGNTCLQYAEAFFSHFDAVTVTPYLGKDSILPFVSKTEKWTILVALTSNIGAEELQLQRLETQEFVFERVLQNTKNIVSDSETRLMYVVGATKSEYLEKVRNIIPHHFLLIPGIGAQGGDWESTIRLGKTKNDIGLLLNISRDIIFSSKDKNFAEMARKKTTFWQEKMKPLLFNP